MEPGRVGATGPGTGGAVTLAEVLEHLGNPGSSLREEAAGELHRALRGICSYFHSRFANVGGVDCDEIVSQAMLTLLELLDRGGVPVRGQGDPVIRAYLRRMIQNLFIDLYHRSRKTETKAEPDALCHPEPETAEPADLRAEFDRVMGPVVRHAIESRAERYRTAFRQAWEHALELCLNDRSMEEVLARNEDPGGPGPEAQRIRARDRVLQQQRRLRKGLEEAVDRLEQAGEMPAEDAALARRICSIVLKRRQKSPAGGVQ